MERETQVMDICENEDENSLAPSKLNMYDTQFFGFTPQTCMLRVCNAFQDCLYDILPVVEKVCVRQLSTGGSAEAEEQLKTGARECSRKLQQVLEERFRKLSERMTPLLVKRCLTVPPNVLLPEDQAHRNYPQAVQAFRLESSITELKSAFEAEVCARQALLAELEEQKEVQKQLDEIDAWVRELQSAWVKEGNSSFHDSFRVVMESVKKLQKAVTEVNKAPHQTN